MTARLLLLTDFPRDFSTFRLALENLARVYRRRGHRVAVEGPWRAPKPAAFWKRPDAVHLHTAGFWNARLTAVADAFADVPMVVTFQDWGNPDLPGNDARGIRGWTRLLAKASAVTAVSRGTALALARSVPTARRTLIVPNAVEEDMFEPARRSRGARRPFVLCPARLSAYKGIDIALMAWRDACAVQDRVDLVFCGPDHSNGRFQRLARRLDLAPRTRFLGPVGRRTMRSLMRSSLFAVLPSRHESFGVAALEAMAAGKAVLATRTDGPSSFLRHGRNGLLAEPGRVEPLSAGLLRLLQNPGLRARLGRSARRTARGYRWETVADAYSRLYGRPPRR